MPTLVEELRALFGGRKLLLTGAPLAALTGRSADTGRAPGVGGASWNRLGAQVPAR
jgi:hypothetical protein